MQQNKATIKTAKQAIFLKESLHSWQFYKKATKKITKQQKQKQMSYNLYASGISK